MSEDPIPGMFYVVRIKKGVNFDERDFKIPDEACFVACYGNQGLNMKAFKSIFQEYGLFAVFKGLNSPKEKPQMKALTLKQINNRMQNCLLEWPLVGEPYLAVDTVCSYLDITVWCAKNKFLCGPDVEVRIAALQAARDEMDRKTVKEMEEAASVKKQEEEKRIIQGEKEKQEEPKEKTVKRREKREKLSEEKAGDGQVEKLNNNIKGRTQEKDSIEANLKEVKTEFGRKETEKGEKRVTFSHFISVAEEEVATSEPGTPRLEEDHEDKIEEDFYNLKDDVLYTAGDSNDIISRYEKLVKKLRTEIKDEKDKNLKMSAMVDMLQVKQIDVSSASGQEFAAQFSSSLDKRFEKMDKTVIRSEQESTRMFYEQKLMLESVVKGLEEVKQENLGNFTDVAEKLLSMSSESEVLKKDVISILQTEVNCCKDSIKTESLEIKEDVKSVSVKLDVLGTKFPEISPRKDVQEGRVSRWEQPDHLKIVPDFSKPPPTVPAASQYTPMNSSLPFYKNREHRSPSRRQRSRSRVARERSRSRSASRGRSSIRKKRKESSSDESRSRSRDVAAGSRRVRAKSTARSPSRSRAKSSARSPSRYRAKSTARSPSRSMAKSTKRSPSRSRIQGGVKRSMSRERGDEEFRSISYDKNAGNETVTIEEEDDGDRPWNRRGDHGQSYSQEWSGQHFRGNSWKTRGDRGHWRGGGRGGGFRSSLFRK